tara:strand:- start:34525 stop:35349 length:825 start_codon:yes stop_codon:yes gene_type:complete
MTEHNFANKTAFITGASRGIGRAIALELAKRGANIVIAAKTKEAHPQLSGTIDSVAKEVEDLGAKALALQVDVRDEALVEQAMKKAFDTFGGIDILINNASAISMTPTTDTQMKRFDLMFDVNVRGTFMCSQKAYQYLVKSDNPHILNLAPPLNLDKKWFKDHVAYTMSKYGMSMCTLGMSEEFKAQGIAVNSLWPKTTIATAAIEFNFPKELIQASRKPAIMSDAALAVLARRSQDCTGNFFIDEEALKSEGVTDFDKYAINPKIPLFLDLFL